MTFENAKQLVQRYQQAVDGASGDVLASATEEFLAPDCHWHCLHPFGMLQGREALMREFWQPLKDSFAPMQRRQDIFLGGFNDATAASDNARAGSQSGQSVWVASMGNFFGLFDRAWLGIPPTGRLTWIRYCEFYEVENDRIVSGAFFFDLLSIMKQAGCYPLPAETGHSFMYPGPATHDGLLFNDADPEAGKQTLALINRMVDDLTELNKSGNDDCPPELLARCWSEDMLWYGPAGIGGSYTIPRYQLQHQFPFRKNLADKKFNGHVCRIAEGDYGCFFGWPNLSNRPTGGFLGLPESARSADMRVVDVYRRQGDKLVENWIFIDLPHYLNGLGLDVLGRMKELNFPPVTTQ